MSEGGQGPSACLPVRGLHKGPTSVMPFQHLNLWLRLTLVIRAPFHTVSTDIQLLGYLVSIDLRTIRPMATEKDTHLCSWNWLICFYCYSYLGFYIVCWTRENRYTHSCWKGGTLHTVTIKSSMVFHHSTLFDVSCMDYDCMYRSSH